MVLSPKKVRIQFSHIENDNSIIVTSPFRRWALAKRWVYLFNSIPFHIIKKQSVYRRRMPLFPMVFCMRPNFYCFWKWNKITVYVLRFIDLRVWARRLLAITITKNKKEWAAKKNYKKKTKIEDQYGIKVQHKYPMISAFAIESEFLLGTGLMAEIAANILEKNKHTKQIKLIFLLLLMLCGICDSYTIVGNCEYPQTHLQTYLFVSYRIACCLVYTSPSWGCGVGVCSVYLGTYVEHRISCNLGDN